MGNPSSSRIRRCALLCVTFGAHLLLFSLISVNESPRDVRTPEEAPGILFFVELPERDTKPATNSKRAISTYDVPLENGAPRDTTIALPPEIAAGPDTFIDWDAEARRVAGNVLRREREEEKMRPLDQHLAGMGPPPPKPPGHRPGDSEHFEGGVIIDWISNRCYYSNQDAHIAAFGPALRLQIPICTGAAGTAGKPLPTFEEWKNEQASR